MIGRKKVLVFGIFAMLIPLGLTANFDRLDSKIATSCGDGFEPIISMQDPSSETSNPGPPELYDYNLCVSGLEESRFSTSCDVNTGFYISSKDNTAHFSEQNDYYWDICTGRMVTRITTGPKTENETELFSVSSRHSGHVAEPNFYDYNVYGRYNPPNNVTVELEFNLSSSDKVYFDDQRVDGERVFGPPAVLPSLISESNDEEIVSGILSESFQRASKSYNDDKNRLRMTNSGADSFLIPFTRGSVGTITSKQDAILENEFVNSVSPNFGFAEKTTPNLRVILGRTDIVSDLSLRPGSHRVNITKTGENEVTLEEVR